MPILVSSFDYDYCLSRRGVKITNILTRNAKLLDFVSHFQVKFDEHIVLVGSNRQSPQKDAQLIGYKNNGSCFPGVKRIAESLGATFDPFLLADLYLNKPNGYSSELFYQALTAAGIDPTKNTITSEHYRALAEDPGHADLFKNCVPFDEGKINILYAQIHKLASEHPTEEIVFDFYDDKSSILTTLSDFFHHFPELLPHNVKLRLCFFNGEELGPIDEAGKPCAREFIDTDFIKGSGIIDEEYKTSLQYFDDIVEEKEPGARERGAHGGVGSHMASYITPTLIAQKRLAMKEKARYAFLAPQVAGAKHQGDEPITSYSNQSLVL